MRRKHTFLKSLSIFSILVLLISMLPFTTQTASSVIKLPAGQEDLFVQNNILFYEPGIASSLITTTKIPCVDGTESIWVGKGYNVTDDDLRGFLRVAIAENGVDGLRLELSIMPNLYEEKNAASWGDTLPMYIQRQPRVAKGWFSTYDAFNDTSYSLYTNRYNREKVEANLELARDIIVNGRRRIPPEVTEHDGFRDGDGNWEILTIEVGDKVYSYTTSEGQAGILDRNNYIQGETTIHTKYDSHYKFWQWAKPNGTGDPFGAPIRYTTITAPTTSCADIGEDTTVTIPPTPEDTKGCLNIPFTLDTDTDVIDDFGMQSYTIKSKDDLKKKRMDCVFGEGRFEIISGKDNPAHGTYIHTDDGQRIKCSGQKGDVCNKFLNQFMSTVDLKLSSGEEAHIQMLEILGSSLQAIFNEIDLNRNKYNSEYEYSGFYLGTIDDEYTYRNMEGDYNYQLSNHSFGGAIDINASQNCMHCTLKPLRENNRVIPHYIANIFVKYGFRWLGDYYEAGASNPRKRYDAMHFTWFMN